MIFDCWICLSTSVCISGGALGTVYWVWVCTQVGNEQTGCGSRGRYYSTFIRKSIQFLVEILVLLFSTVIEKDGLR
jgi:hypothetical protein